MFGSGFGEEDADMTPIYESVIDYEHACLSQKQILIPASSVKGALAHRTTYYYNRLQGNTIENQKGIETVKEIFGEAKNSKDKIEGSKGKLILSDCFQTNNKSTKTFDHVSIDRFTGGAIDGALFQEKTVADEREYKIEILLHISVKDKELQAFETALTDITTGMLSLGGATTKGHGIFNGTWSRL
jgi:CRISPR/Cas system CSM-associated protein Csm3 (group 7 of RAMP superfamily)